MPEQTTPLEYESAAGTAPPDCFVHNKLLVLRDGAATPPRCVRCNAEAAGGLVPVALRAPINAEGGVFWSLIAAVEFFHRQTVHSELALCPSCKTRRSRWMGVARVAVWLFGLTLAVGVGVFVAIHFHAIDRDFGAVGVYCFLAGAVGLLLSLTRRSRLRSVLRVRQVEGGLAWMSGADPQFLAGLPKID